MNNYKKHSKMKNIQLLFLILIISCFCGNDIKGQDVKMEKETLVENKLITAEFTITGMACQEGCADVLQENIMGLLGVQKALISYEKAFAVILFDSKSVSIDDIVSVIKETKVKEYIYNVENITIKE